MQRLSVIVPHHGDPSGLAGCLRALAAQSVPPDEIVIAVNGPVDRTAETRAVVAMTCPAAVVIHAPQAGAGPARNAGVAATTGDWLAFIDSDCLAAPDWVAAGRRALERHTAFGGTIDVVAADAARPSAVEAFDLEFGFDAGKFLRRSGHLITANMFCTRAAFDRVGPFACGIPEDRDWSYRARACGIALAHVADVVVEHPALATWPQLRYRWRRMTAEEFVFNRDRPLRLLGFWLRGWLVLASIGPHSVRLVRSRRALRVPAGSLIVLARSRLDRFLYTQRLVISALR